MRHVVVTRVVLLLALLLAGACLIFASRGGPARSGRGASAETGADLFARRCAGCHAVADVGSAWPAEAEAARARDALLRFLEGHGHSEPHENERLVEFLGDASRER